MRRIATLAVLVVAVAGALILAPSQTKPAEAGIFGGGHVFPKAHGLASRQAFKIGTRMMWRYDINISVACHQQRGAGTFGHAHSYYNPYSWGCYRVASWVPYRWSYHGGVDLNRYCRENHPGTWAHLEYPTAYGWSCVQDMTLA
jgi:hypothetical protein